MAEAGRRPVEGVIEGDVHWRRGHPFLYESTSAVRFPRVIYARFL
jgi:hypothetical protein